MLSLKIVNFCSSGSSFYRRGSKCWWLKCMNTYDVGLKIWKVEELMSSESLRKGKLVGRMRSDEIAHF
jgi:hypothetical protein